ncbi:hypothetical protein FRC07_004983 [Ceratobasidium sp. 392]|nr:hypothetical protein FRC07_004983 [Ceratobasidium sp. 392]
MRVTLSTLLALVAYVAAQADPSINTPAQLVQCQPAQITWTASKSPAFVSIIPGGQPGAAALHDFGQQSGNSLTWTVNIAAGTQITFQVRDSSGAVAYSAPSTIQSSSDSSCLGQQPSGGASSSAAPSGSATSTPAGPSSAASTSAAVSSSASEASTSAAASTSSVVASVSSAVVSVSSAASTATRPPTSSSRPPASATSASSTPSTSPNSARSNAKVGLAGLLGLAAAVVMA